METKDKNKLIAEFMGLCVETDAIGRHKFYTKTIGVINYHYPQYESSWEWLMPVFEKICRTKIGDGITYVEYPNPRTFGMLHRESGQIMVRLNAFQLFMADTLLEATYLAVVDFIEWYNYKQAKDETGKA